MKRVIYVPDSLNNKKYVLRDEYEGFGIYEEVCPSGYYVHQSWLIYNGKIGYISQSYNNKCKEELMDTIANYNETGQFGLHGFMAKADEERKRVYGKNKTVCIKS